MSPSQGWLKVGEAEIVWICAEEGERIYWTPARQEGKRKTSEKTDGCSDGGCAEGWRKMLGSRGRKTVLCFHRR